MKQALFFAATLVVMATSAEATRMYEPQDYRSIVPTDWRLLPPDPGSHERRFVSPLGDAWLSLYAEPVDREPIPAHIERVRNAPGEMITYERREPSWIVVSGYKGNRIFYRRATLACENRQWHHIAFFADRCHWLYLNVVMQKKKPCAGGSAGFHLSTGNFRPLRSRRLSVHALINWIIPPLSFSSGRRQQKLRTR